MKISLFILALLFSSITFAKPVNVNSASAKEISTSLTGIGMKKAQAIVEYREKHGSFKSAQSLAKVKGIGHKTVEKNIADILLEDVSG